MFIVKGEHDNETKILAQFERKEDAEKWLKEHKKQGFEAKIVEKKGHVDPPSYRKKDDELPPAPPIPEPLPERDEDI